MKVSQPVKYICAQIVYLYVNKADDDTLVRLVLYTIHKKKYTVIHIQHIPQNEYVCNLHNCEQTRRKEEVKLERLKKYQTFTQETTIHVPCETRSQR